ncbi:MAG: hypothetical protein ABW123_25135, partial [Cystobacter sp.]
PQPGSPPGGLQVQVRHQHLPEFTAWASFNTAAVVKAGDYTFEVRMPRDPDGRFPLDKRRDLELLINGERVSLNPQLYVINNDLIFRVTRGNGLEVTYRDPTAVQPLPHPDAAFSRVRIGTRGETNLIRNGGDPREPVLSIDVSLETSGSYLGLLGTPDGNAGNDFMKPDGTVLPGPTTEFVNSYLLREADESLFTYQSGEGPATFAVSQSSALPGLAELGPDLERVRILLAETCGLTAVEVAAVDPEFIKQSAYELAAGRTENNMVASGLCGDGQVRPPPNYISFVLTGKATLAGRPDVGVRGARVRIIARERGRVLCDTVTIEDGRYGCGFPQDAADYASLTTLTLDYTVSGRGTELTRSLILPPPVPNSTVHETQDFEAVVSRVLDLRGRVRDTQGVPLSGALVRLESPQYADALTDANGEYQQYVVLPEGIRGGALKLKTVSRNGQFSGSVSTSFDVPNAGIHTLSLDINTLAVPDALPPPQSQSLLAVNGRLLNALVQQASGETVPILGATVRVRRKETNEEFCHTEVADPQGRWGCQFLVPAGMTGPLTLRVEADGLPSSRRELVLAEAEMPGPGQAVVRSLELTARATTLLFQGRATASTGSGLGDVEVTCEPLNFPRISARTSANGTYRAFVSLPTEERFEGPAVARATLKGAGGMGSLERRETLVLSANAGEMTSQTWDVTFSTGVAVLSGRVLNQLAADEPVAGAFVSVQAGGSTLCEATSDADGFYGCSVSNESGGKLQLTYRVDRRGQGVFTTFNGQPAELDLSTVPPATVLPILPTRDLRVRPTTLRIQGVVRDSMGRAVAGAQVGASLDGFKASPVYSAEDGRFTLTLPVEEGRTSGKVRVSTSRVFAAGALTAQAEPTFTVPIAHELVNVPVDLTLNGPIPAEDTAVRLHFMGRIDNALLPGTPLGGARVEVRLGAGGPLLCSSGANDHGDYDCRALVAPAPPSPSEFEYTVRIAGTSVGPPLLRTWSFARSPQVEARLMWDLAVHPTTLVLRGRVTSDGTTPIAGVEVSFTGAAIGSARTDEQGDYTLAVALSPSSTAFSGVLTASINRLSTTRALSGALEPGGLVRRTEDLQLAQRRLKLRGSVSNALAAGSVVREARVELRRAGELLCETNLEFSTGSFACPEELVLWDAAPVSLEWKVRNTFDEREGSVTLATGDLPAAGQVGQTNLVLSLRATALLVTGQVLNAAGVAVKGAVVRASAAGSLVEGRTAEDGSYQVVLSLKDTLAPNSGSEPTANLTTEVRAGTDLGTTSGIVSAPRGELTPVTRNMNFTQVTRLLFRGAVLNVNTDNREAVRNARVRILREGVDPALGLLCEADMLLGTWVYSYLCNRDLHGESLTSL